MTDGVFGFLMLSIAVIVTTIGTGFDIAMLTKRVRKLETLLTPPKAGETRKGEQ